MLPLNAKKERDGRAPLTWRNDPLLFDPKPLGQNHWLIADELIVSGRRATIFLEDDLSLNLYPIMVRRADFVTAKRLLQSMPYLVLDPSWAQRLRKRSLAVAERCAHYFTSSPANFSIVNWQKKIIRYSEEQRRIPFPIFRLMDDWRSFFKNQQKVIRFQSARGEDFWLPLHLSEELAYLVGICAGDGHLAEYAIYIVDYSKEHIGNIARKMEQWFGGDVLLYSQEEYNAYNLCQKGKWLVRLINFLSGQTIAGKKYGRLQEPLLLKENEAFQRAFWRGMMDSDGSYITNISFCSSSERLIGDFCSFLKDNRIAHSVSIIQTETGKGQVVFIRSASRKQFIEVIEGTNHPKKKKQLIRLLERTGKIAGGLSQKTYEIGGIRQDRLILDNEQYYFDFSYLPKIQVVGVDLQQNLQLAKITQKELLKKIGISKERLAHYASGKVPIPIFVLQKLLEISGQKSLMRFLADQGRTRFSSSRTQATLPLKPNEELIERLAGSILRGAEIIDYISSKIDQIAEYFTIKVTKKGKISNSVLRKFILTFMEVKARP